MKRVVGKEMIMVAGVVVNSMIVEVMTLEAREVEVMIRKVTEATIEATVKFIPPLIASRRERHVGL
jgi:hypothetical protein